MNLIEFFFWVGRQINLRKFFILKIMNRRKNTIKSLHLDACADGRAARAQRLFVITFRKGIREILRKFWIFILTRTEKN